MDAGFARTLAVQAAGRGNPWVNLLDGREVPSEFKGPAELSKAMQERTARPKTLASADFDEDGVLDLVAAYEAGKGPGGLMVLHRGNVDAIYPYAPEAKVRKAKGTFTDAPFLPEARGDALVERFAFHLGRGASVAAAMQMARRDLIARGAPAACSAGLLVLGDGDIVPRPGGAGSTVDSRILWIALPATTGIGLLLYLLRRRRHATQV